MTELFEYGKQVLAAQPFSRSLGARLTLLEIGRAGIALDLVEDLKQQHGFAHGGVLSYLADNCMTYAGASVLGDSVTSIQDQLPPSCSWRDTDREGLCTA